ncbi:MAG: hypothetical protein Q8N14_02835 [Candidatus Omnitrophota bacterium]|nr:hypothetical protein [Candidatus Omnitrophota bacterium]
MKKKIKYEKPKVTGLSRNIAWKAEGVPAECVSGIGNIYRCAAGSGVGGGEPSCGIGKGGTSIVD